MANVGLSGIVVLLSLLVPIVLIVIVIAALIRIRNATERTAQRLDEIHRLLKDNDR